MEPLHGLAALPVSAVEQALLLVVAIASEMCVMNNRHDGDELSCLARQLLLAAVPLPQRRKECWHLWTGLSCTDAGFDDLNETLPLLAAVRDPVDRAISQARYQMRWEHRDYEDAAGVWCRNETFDRYIMERLRRSEQSRFMDDCHWIPQLE